GAISQETYLKEFFLKRGESENCWRNMLSWWQVRERDDVMPLIYEDMADDLPNVVRRVAAFIGLDASEQTLAIATDQAQFDFMKTHAHHFDDHLLRDKCDVAAGLPAGGESNKVSSGQSGKEPLSEELVAMFDEAWNDLITAETGLEDYPAFRSSIRETASV
ncbi:MAG: sulfotransferase domain-containing protein, partial [Alphaproteobacteria bacterium]